MHEAPNQVFFKDKHMTFHFVIHVSKLRSVGLILTLWWASEIVVCKAPSLIIWNFAFILINSCYVCALIKKHFPTFLSAEMLEFYELIFKPLQISKTDFQNFVKYGKTETYSFGRHFSQEHRTNVDKKLYILLSGMMTVRCDGFFLQAIQPMELINSVEWRCNQYGQTFTTYQVSKIQSPDFAVKKPHNFRLQLKPCQSV